MIENGTILENRYLIERQIGAGGMGAVYLATDQRFDSPVAIKETFYNEADLRDAFEREARLLNSLHHPVLPHVSDFFSAGSKHFLVMEYIEGEDLSEILKQAGAFNVEDVLRWTDRLLDALDFLHSQEPPIIHRDIKPNNLKITTRGDIVLLDFGLAKLSSSDTTNAKSVFGYSRKYSPLEQIQGTGTDARSDIFSLGATVFHLLTGQPPIDVLARASAIVAGKPDPLPLVSDLNAEIPPAVAQVLNKALMLNPELRFESAKAARVALQQALNADAVSEIERTDAVEPALIMQESAAETENFPALESFVETQDLPNAGDVKSPAVQISIPAATSSQTHRTDSPHTATVTDVVTQVRRPQNRALLPLALAAAILIWGSLAVWLVTKPAKSSSEDPSRQTAPVVQQPPILEEESDNSPAPIVAAEPPETLEDSVAPETTPEISYELPAEDSSEPPAEVKPAPRKINKAASRTIAETEKPAIVEVEEKPVKIEAPARSQTRQPEPKARLQSTQNSASRRDSEIESRPRIVQTPRPGLSRVINSAPLGDVQTPPKDAPPVRRNQMSDAEKEELRRRRLESILRHNRQPNRQN